MSGPEMVNSWELFSAVAVASVMGSLHCVGMCGPFALWASGAGSSLSAGKITTRISLYHLGRLATYVSGGVLVGIAGAVLTSGGNTLGIQSAAARIAGVTMIVFAVARIARTVRPLIRRSGTGERSATGGAAKDGFAAGGPVSGGLIAGWLVKWRPTIHRLPPPFRAFAAGGLTTLLPCGWLYLFLIFAGGTGSVASAIAVMIAFWLGTLPALTSLMVGAIRFAPRVRPALPLAGGLLLLVTGLYTATGRASADLTRLSDRPTEAERLVESGRLVEGERIVEGELGSERHGAGVGDPLQTLDELSNRSLPCCSLDD